MSVTCFTTHYVHFTFSGVVVGFVQENFQFGKKWYDAAPLAEVVRCLR